jgi:DNA-binding CsgD family transcriptional regulator
LHYFRLAPSTNMQCDNYNKWYLMGKTFLRKGELDSAKIYLAKVKDPAPMTVDYYQLWQEFYERKGQLSEALHFAKRVTVAKDSIQEHALTTSFAGLEKKYRYEHLAVDNNNLVIQNKQRGIILLIVLLASSIFGFVFLLWRFRVNKRQLVVQKQLLDQEKALMEREKENNILLQKHMNLQHVLLKNVEQYRKQAIKRPESTPEEKTEGSKSSQVSTVHEELIYHIDVTHRNISRRLVDSYPNLTRRDILICCLLLANFDTGMIATILEVQTESINVHRSRLRKKLQLQNSENLLQFLLNF